MARASVWLLRAASDYFKPVVANTPLGAFQQRVQIAADIPCNNLLRCDRPKHPRALAVPRRLHLFPTGLWLGVATDRFHSRCEARLHLCCLYTFVTRGS
jgi:hypothetical protein